MSRVGKKSIPLPNNVTFEKKERSIIVSGPKGQLILDIDSNIEVSLDKGNIVINRQSEAKKVKSLHGLTRSLIANMITGVVDGFTKTLEIQGTGYRAAIEAGKLKLAVGHSHSVEVRPPEGIEFKVEENNIIKVSGADKQLVGQVAAKIRQIRKPEPYKGKGIRYQKEKIKLKPGKAAKTGAGAA